MKLSVDVQYREYGPTGFKWRGEVSGYINGERYGWDDVFRDRPTAEQCEKMKRCAEKRFTEEAALLEEGR